jgi:hypothetical protein
VEASEPIPKKGCIAVIKTGERIKDTKKKIKKEKRKQEKMKKGIKEIRKKGKKEKIEVANKSR